MSQEGRCLGSLVGKARGRPWTWDQTVFLSCAWEDSDVFPARRHPGKAGVLLRAPCRRPCGFHQGVFSPPRPGSVPQQSSKQGTLKCTPTFSPGLTSHSLEVGGSQLLLLVFAHVFLLL